MLENEIGIRWNEEPDGLPYLREGTHETTQPKQMFRRMKNGRVVAYAVHAPKGYRTAYLRRFWYLLDHDAGQVNDDGTYRPPFFPIEAVRVESVQAGAPSKKP